MFKIIRETPYFRKTHWRGARAVEWDGFENHCGQKPPGVRISLSPPSPAIAGYGGHSPP